MAGGAGIRQAGADGDVVGDLADTLGGELVGTQGADQASCQAAAAVAAVTAVVALGLATVKACVKVCDLDLAVCEGTVPERPARGAADQSRQTPGVGGNFVTGPGAQALGMGELALKELPAAPDGPGWVALDQVDGGPRCEDVALARTDLLLQGEGDAFPGRVGRLHLVDQLSLCGRNGQRAADRHGERKCHQDGMAFHGAGQRRARRCEQ